ncbi:MAG TPA: ABC transporter permease [Bryobacteraceae bacterium]|jgi:predicted permease
MSDPSIPRSRFHRFVSQLRALVPGARADAGLEEEVAAHIELQTRKHIQAGMSAEEARRRARLDFGGIENAKEACRDARRAHWLSSVMQDLRYAFRGFLRARGFTALIISTLGLGIGANLAIFSVTDAILLRMLPVGDPASLFRTVNANGNAYDLGSGVSYPVYRKMQKRAEGLADLMAYQAAAPVSISINNSEPERLMQQTVSGNYFEVLGVGAGVGRMISPHDDSEAGQHAVAVISHRLWQTRFGKAERALGTKFQFGGHTFEIIGVTPPGFFGVEVGKMVDVWTPASMAPADNLANDHMFWLRTMGRLHPGVTIAQAAAPLQEVMNEFMLEDVRQHAPPGTPKRVIDRFLAGTRIKGVPAGGGISNLRREYRQPLFIMIVVVGLVLLIACSSVANLLIARGSARQQEIAIRLSLGAHRRRILQQLITESVLLACLAASLGLLLARLGTPLLVRLLAPSNQHARLAAGNRSPPPGIHIIAVAPDHSRLWIDSSFSAGWRRHACHSEKWCPAHEIRQWMGAKSSGRGANSLASGPGHRGYFV